MDKFVNLASGTLSAGITAASTTLTSAAYAALPVISTPDTLKITLDPSGVAGAPEIVVVTAHTAASTSITVVRQQEPALGGGAARIHASGTVWLHGLTAQTMLQIPVFCSSTTRPGSNGTPPPQVGTQIVESDTGRVLWYSSVGTWVGMRCLAFNASANLSAPVTLPVNQTGQGGAVFVLNDPATTFYAQIGDIVQVDAGWRENTFPASGGYMEVYPQLYQPVGSLSGQNLDSVVGASVEVSKSGHWEFTTTQAGIHSVTLTARTAYGSGTMRIIPSTFMCVNVYRLGPA